MKTTTSFLARLAAATTVALVAGACGGGTGANSDSPVERNITELGIEGSEGDAEEVSLPSTDPVPVDQGNTIEFEMVSAVIDEEWPVELMVPQGWHVENDIRGTVTVKIRDHDDQGRLSGEPGDETSIFTRMEFETGCDGMCEANDWQARLNGPDGWLTLHRDGAEILRDEALPGGWVLIERDRRIEVTVLRWEDHASRYLECFVEIDSDDAHLVDQFVDACGDAVLLWSDS